MNPTSILREFFHALGIWGPSEAAEKWRAVGAMMDAQRSTLPISPLNLEIMQRVMVENGRRDMKAMG